MCWPTVVLTFTQIPPQLLIATISAGGGHAESWPWFSRSCWLITNGKAWKFFWNHMIVVSKFRWFSSNSFWFTNFNERLLLFFCLGFYWFIRFWFGAICNWEKLVCVGSRIWTVLSLSWCTGFIVCRVAKYHHVRIWQLIHNIRTAELNSFIFVRILMFRFEGIHIFLWHQVLWVFICWCNHFLCFWLRTFLRNFSKNIFSVFFHIGLYTLMHRLKIPDGIC